MCNYLLVVHDVLRPDLYSYEEQLSVQFETDVRWMRGETVIDARGHHRWPSGWRGPIRDTGNWHLGKTYYRIDVVAAVDVTECPLQRDYERAY